MTITNLKAVGFGQLSECFNQAFSNYFVPFHLTEDMLRQRWKQGRIQAEISCGVFQDDQLIAFIINGLDQWQGTLTAYNGGTGVIPKYQGQGISGKMYKWLLPQFKAHQITQSILEVICENHNAIKAYERAGFQIVRTLHCFRQEKAPTASALDSGFSIQPVTKANWESYDSFWQVPWDWSSQQTGIEALGEDIAIWELREDQQCQGYCVIQPSTNKVLQWGFPEKMYLRYGLMLLPAVFSHYEGIRINNIDADASLALELIKELGLVTSISQYEMLKPIT